MTPTLLLLGVLVVVPAALPLHPAFGRRSTTAAVVAALPLVPGLVLAPGMLAAALALPWFAFAATATLLSGRYALRHRDDPWLAAWTVASAYLAFGAAWLVADRLDLEPAGVTVPFVLLTAVHFHYAGFVATTLATRVRDHVPSSRPASAALAATMGAPPLIAAGFAAVPVLQVVGAVLLTVGLWLLAWVTVRRVAPTLERTPRLLLVVSAVSVLVPMVLAVQWAVGANFGTPALSIPAMARTHGLVNAVGFALPGVAAWRLAGRPVVAPAGVTAPRGR